MTWPSGRASAASVARSGLLRGRRRPGAVLGLALLAAETLAAAVGAGDPMASLVVLVVAPGLALGPLLPRELLVHPVARAAAAGTLGFAALGVALVSASRIGVPLDPVTVRVVAVALVLAGLAAFAEEAGSDDAGVNPSGWWHESAALAAICGLALFLADRATGGTPPPGNDWAKYVLYADEIRRQGALLIDNPFWMLGVPFREDPGTPAVYGAALLAGGGAASSLTHGIWLLMLLAGLSTFAAVRAFAGAVPALTAAAFVILVPASQDIMAWHGLANVAALGLLALIIAGARVGVRRRLSHAEAVGLGLLLVALAATHRLSAAVGLGIVGVALLAGLAERAGRRRMLDNAWRVAAAGIGLGVLVAADLLARQRTFGGSLPYEAYLDTKIDWVLLLRAVSVPFALGAGLGLAALAAGLRRDRSLLVLLGGPLAAVALAYTWLLALPGYYLRSVFFLPVLLAPVIAVGVARLPARVAVAVACVGIAATSVLAYGQAGDVRRFYGFATPAALRGLDALEAQLRPGEVVVTDRCWSFLATWLLRTRTLPAIEPQDIQPAAELPFARRAQAILDGAASGGRDARRLGVRFAVADPTCVGGDGRPIPPPAVGRPVFLSERLAIFRLDG